MYGVQITSEADLLDETVRRKLIEHFDCQANQHRKHEAFKAYECLKDKTENYVLDLLLRQFDYTTVNEMMYAMSNISVLRKVIDKLAKVYANGCKRSMPATSDTKKVEEDAKYLDMDQVMKKCDKYFRTFKNTLAYARPIKNEDKYDIKVEILPPFKYDAVENPDNPQEAMAIVLSDYVPKRKTLYAFGDAAYAGRTGVGEVREVGVTVTDAGEIEPVMLKQQASAPTKNLQNQADSASEDDKRQFIWWSKNYHFTTNAKGQILAKEKEEGEEESDANPILEMPFVNFAAEQDGNFWAEGGGDLVDAGIKINVGLTNLEHVGFTQGYGQMWMVGKNLPKSIKVGPTHCVQLEVENKDDPQPSFGFATSNPPLGELRQGIEMRTALMLSTNNLSTKSFSTNLQGGKDFASGIAMMIDKSESVEDVNEQAQIFIKNEPKVWGKVAKWHEVYKSLDLLTEEASALKFPKDVEKKLQVSFPSPQPIMSELDELTIIEKRKELSLNTEVELLMRDDPSLTEETAKAKLEQIKAEKQANMEAAATAMGGEDDGTGNQDQESGGDGGQDNVGDRPGATGKPSGSDQTKDQE